jgi:hypothetical protein
MPSFADVPAPEKDDPPPVQLADVLKAEQEEIAKIRLRRESDAGTFPTGKKRTPVSAPAAPIPGRTPLGADEPEWQTSNEEDDKKWREAIKEAHDANLVGLAFSGGGIRSATFNLGVLQALADLKLLYRIDYLSTVSGGGYIGGWLAAWTKRLKSFAKVQERLSANRVHQEEDKEPTEIRFLRVFSNYLTPKLGIFTGDTWAMVAIYLRNLLLNLVIVLAGVAAFLLLPGAIESLASALLPVVQKGQASIWGLVAAVLLLLAFVVILINMEYLNPLRNTETPQSTQQGWALSFLRVRAFAAAVWTDLLQVVSVARGERRQPENRPRELARQRWILFTALSLFATAVLAGLWLVARFKEGQAHHAIPYWKAAVVGAISYGLVWVVASLPALACSAIADWKTKIRLEPEPGSASRQAPPIGRFTLTLSWLRQLPTTLLGAVCAGAVAGWLYALLSWLSLSWELTAKLALTAGVPLALGILLLAGTLHVGLIGTKSHEAVREWWGRLGGWLLLSGISWLAIFWTALYLPDFIEHSALVGTTWKKISAEYLTPAWILSTLISLLAGKSKRSGKPGEQTALDAAAKVGPYVFTAGLFCWMSYAISYIQGQVPWTVSQLWVRVGACLGIAALMARRVDINLFSMHLFYRNRLVRCYLGASNEARSPNRFTGFDPNDDLPLKDFLPGKGYDGPYPIFNASLNLTKGQELAWQERKAESFVMTPKYCGYDVWLEEQDSPMLSRETAEDSKRRAHKRTQDKPPGWWEQRWGTLERFGYRNTEMYAFPSSRPGWVGPKLGLAMGVSGAAASPNMGFYSSPPVAFLLTVFNVRLGQWLGNPRHSKTSGRPTPLFGLPYLANELLGRTDDHARYVYLSDGGHFDNLGLYELVKRRCGLIVVCDAEEDKDYKFAGLGNAIRKCRTDMGIDIDLDVSEITPKEKDSDNGKDKNKNKDGLSQKHCAIGTIHYEYADMNAPRGTIIYFKASLTGDEHTDLKNYKKTKKHASFPHESTIDQWFSESQFESYRQLGYHEVRTSIQGTTPAGSQPDQLSWWSTAGAVVREALRGIAGVAAPPENGDAKPEPLEERLYRIFKDFGFEMSALKVASESQATLPAGFPE